MPRGSAGGEDAIRAAVYLLHLLRLLLEVATGALHDAEGVDSQISAADLLCHLYRVSEGSRSCVNSIPLTCSSLFFLVVGNFGPWPH